MNAEAHQQPPVLLSKWKKSPYPHKGVKEAAQYFSYVLRSPCDSLFFCPSVLSLHLLSLPLSSTSSPFPFLSLFFRHLPYLCICDSVLISTRGPAPPPPAASVSLPSSSPRKNGCLSCSQPPTRSRLPKRTQARDASHHFPPPLYRPLQPVRELCM